MCVEQLFSKIDIDLLRVKRAIVKLLHLITLEQLLPSCRTVIGQLDIAYLRLDVLIKLDGLNLIKDALIISTIS